MNTFAKLAAVAAIAAAAAGLSGQANALPIAKGMTTAAQTGAAVETVGFKGRVRIHVGGWGHGYYGHYRPYYKPYYYGGCFKKKIWVKTKWGYKKRWKTFCH